RFLAAAQLDDAVPAPGEKVGAALPAGTPGPERRLVPVAVGGQIGYGMVLAAQTMTAAVIVDDAIMQFLKTRQFRQQVQEEPEVRLGVAQAADGDFEVVAAPAPLEGPAGCRKSLAEQRRAPPLLPHFRPEVIEQ